tara:strand:+ start:182 stop:820 length:639 start_codon:yes stop_codon:yes gene_type:complete
LINKGFKTNQINVLNAVNRSNEKLNQLPKSLFKSIDFKTTSAIIGCLFCEELAQEVGAITNPIEKGHPDIVPKKASVASEKSLRNYPEGIEIKTTIGNIKQGLNLRSGQRRIDNLTGITWQAHHREVSELMGLCWDFAKGNGSISSPCITGVFYSDCLSVEDWGVISGTSGRNTKVCGMKSSGRKKMGKGYIVMINEPDYLKKFQKLLSFNL